MSRADPDYEIKSQILKQYDESKLSKKRGRPKSRKRFTQDVIEDIRFKKMMGFTDEVLKARAKEVAKDIEEQNNGY